MNMTCRGYDDDPAQTLPVAGLPRDRDACGLPRDGMVGGVMNVLNPNNSLSPVRTLRTNKGGGHAPRRLKPVPAPDPRLRAGETAIESDAQREDRIQETWGETGTVDHIADQDAIWFLGHAHDWADPFMALAGWDTWPRDDPGMTPLAILMAGPREYAHAAYVGEEPMPTGDVIRLLEVELARAADETTADFTPANLRRERNLRLALEGLRARYVRTGDENMGW